MNRVTMFIMIVFLMFFSYSVAFSWEKKDYVTYFDTTDNPVTCAWSAVEGAAGYQVQLLHVERDSTTIVSREALTDRRDTFLLQRSGHFIVKVRACKYDFNTCEVHSEWTESINSERSRVDDQPRAWWLYGYIAPPGEITINSYHGEWR